MNLVNLPSELIAQIFIFLDDQDVFSARLSNKTLDNASFSDFGKRFFRKRGFMITTPSLQVLQHVSEHQELSKYVQHVWFNPDCFTWNPPDYSPENQEDRDEGIVLSPSTRVRQDRDTRKQYQAYEDCLRDHHRLLNDYDAVPSRFELLVTSAFRNLPNLKTIGMRRSEHHSPYGWTQLQKAIGQDPRLIGPMPPLARSFLSKTTLLFIALISSIANSGIKPQRFYTDAVELDHIHPDDLPPSKLSAACSSILYVELNIVKARLTPSTSSIASTHQLRRRALDDDDSHSQPHLSGQNLLTLLHAMPHLKELGLQILLEKSLRFAPEFRKSYPYLTSMRLADEIALPHLTRVKLERIIATAGRLQNLLLPCADHLTSLKLRDIRLLSTETDARPWRAFFTFLATRCPKLEYILFYHLMHDSGGVSFVEEESEAMPEEDMEEFMVGQAVFEKYSHITLEVKESREAVRAKLEEVAERHWYHKPLFSYAMDEELWHTDTSDEEW